MGAITKGLSSVIGGGAANVLNPLTDALTQQNQYNLDTVQNPVSQGQYETSHGQSQEALAQQAQFLQALQAQGGIQNQADVYNQLSGIAQGQGPNPAQAALQQATAQNAAQQAALMASQRGSGANIGLMARQAAMQGGNLQQQAAQQAAVLQAQQSLGAINSMGNIAGQQVGNQAAALSGYNQFAQNNQAQMLQGLNAQNDARLRQGAINAGVSSENTAAKQKTQSGLIQGAGSALGMAAGGTVPSPSQSHTAEGGLGQYFSHFARGGQAQHFSDHSKPVPGKAKMKGDNLKNDTVSAKLSPGEIVIPRSVAQGKDAVKKSAEFVAAVLKRNSLKK